MPLSGILLLCFLLLGLCAPSAIADLRDRSIRLWVIVFLMLIFILLANKM